MYIIKNHFQTRNFLLVTILIISISGPGFAQALPSGGGDGSSDLEDKNFNFVPVPYINYSRSLGFAIGAIPMAMYKLNPKDTISPASIRYFRYVFHKRHLVCHVFSALLLKRR